MTADVTLVIPVWNRADLLARLLDTVEQQTVRPARVLCVDNGSTDDAVGVARTNGAEVIEIGRNTGFAAAVNVGLQNSQTDWVAVLNTDVELDARWLERLLDAAQGQNAWFACGQIRDARDPSRLDGTWDLIARSGCPWRAGHARSAMDAAFQTSRGVAMTTWTAALFRATLFEALGLLDESFDSYLEDVDFGLRCMAAGRLGVYEPSAFCTHVGSASSAESGGVWSSRVTALASRNQLRLARQYGFFQRWPWQVLVGQSLWGLLALRHGAFRAWFSGKLAACCEPRRGCASEALLQRVTESECELAALQRASPDSYWRLYFLFTGGVSR